MTPATKKTQRIHLKENFESLGKTLHCFEKKTDTILISVRKILYEAAAG